MSPAGPRIAADIGGTFTDVALIRADGAVATRKGASPPPTTVRGAWSRASRS